MIWQLKQQINNYKLNKLKIANNMKNFSIKIFSFLLISILSLTIITNNNKAEAKMFNKFKKGFYFEKYKTAEEAKAALLELHPIGSDVEGLIKTLERAGVHLDIKINRKDLLSDPIREREYFSEEVKSASSLYVYDYSIGAIWTIIFLINPIKFSVFTYCNDKNKVIRIHVSRYLNI
jgi:hypothetical protein